MVVIAPTDGRSEVDNGGELHFILRGSVMYSIWLFTYSG